MTLFLFDGSGSLNGLLEWGTFREANAKARRLLRFSEGRERETSDSAAQITGDRFKADDRLQTREARQLSQLRTDPPRTPVSASENGQEDTMEAEGGGDDFNNNEAITGTCNDMCSGGPICRSLRILWIICRAQLNM